MRAVITSGGTAGHIYPALAVARELMAMGHELLFAGTPNSQEARLVAAEGLIPYAAFAATGFNRSRPSTLPSFLWRTATATAEAKKWLDKIKPNVVAGFGGYASVPVCRAALQSRIPVLIHEQNSKAGWANRLLAQKAAAIALTYEGAREQLAHAKKGLIEITGCPVRRSLLDFDDPYRRNLARAAFRAMYEIPADALVLMVFGGSQGARSINDAIVAQAQSILSLDNVHILHLTGPRQYSVVTAQLAQTLAPEQAQRWHTIDYCTQMGEAYVSSDLVVSRAGASSLAEIAALGIPALLVPYPHATDDHQTANARSLVAAGAACFVADAELTKPIFMETLLKLLGDETLRASMATAARAAEAGAATQKLIDLLLKIAG